MAATAAAAVVLLALLITVALFARLPPAPRLLLALGYPAIPASIERALVEPDGKSAWLVLRQAREGTASSWLACHVALGTGRASRCHELLDAAHAAPGWRLHHAWGDGSVMLALSRLTRPVQAPIQVVIATGDEAMARRTAIDLRALGLPPTTELLNATYDAAGSQFLLVLGSGALLRALAIRPDGTVGDGADWSERLEAGDRSWRALAAYPHAGGVLAQSHERIAWLRDGHAEPVDTSKCASPPSNCLQPASGAGAFVDAGAGVTIWLDQRGQPHPVQQRHDAQVRLTELLAADGGSRPLVATADSRENRLHLQLDGAAGLDIAFVFGGGEAVMTAGPTGGAREPVSRHAWHATDWTAVAHPGGALLMDRRHGIALDAAGKLRGAQPGALRRLSAIAADRYALAPAATLLYLALLIAGLPLSLLGWWRWLHRQRATRTLLALGAYGAAGLLLLWFERAHLFAWF